MRVRLTNKLLVMLFLTACTPDDASVTAPTNRANESELLHPNAPLNALARTSNGPETFDEYYARLADSIPGFAGFYYDGDGNPVIALTDLGTSQIARTKLKHFTEKKASARRTRATVVRVVKAQHDYKTLYGWRRWIEDNLINTAGLVLTDIDEVNNWIRVGVLTADNATLVSRAATEQGIAIKVTIEDPDEFSFRSKPAPRALSVSSSNALLTANDYLYSEFTSMPGGVQIERSNLGPCSIGFNAYKSSTDQGVYDFTRYFVTAAHCTNGLGNTENTAFYQPTRASNFWVGTERREAIYKQYPQMSQCPNDPRIWCATSDVALVEYTGGANWELGKIAQTTFFGNGDQMGSKEIDPLHPRFTIVDSMELIPIGTELDRVGIASGWVYGTMTESCANARVFSEGVQTDFWILCSGIFDATLREGDSGGPVFKVLNLPSGEVELAGIAWSGGFRRTRFSKYAHISYDLTDRDRSFACYQFNCWPRLTVSAP